MNDEAAIAGILQGVERVKGLNMKSEFVILKWGDARIYAMSSTVGAPSRILTITLAVIAILALAILAAPQLIYPFGHDQGIFSACGDVIRRGGVPIKDCFESKGPGVMVLYAVALSVSFSTVSVTAFVLLWQALTSVVVGITAARLFHPWAAWPAGAAYWLMYAGINYWSMNQAETFSNLFIVLAILLAWRANEIQRTNAALPILLVGVCAGVLLWFKYTFALFVVAIGLALLIHTWLRTKQFKVVLTSGVWYSAGVVLVGATGLLYYALAGGIPALVEQVGVFRELFPLGPPRTFPEIVQFLWRFTDNGADLTGDYKATVQQMTLFGGGFPLLFVLAVIGLVAPFISPHPGPLPAGEGSQAPSPGGRGVGGEGWLYVLLVFVAGLGVVAWQAKYVQYHFTILHGPVALAAGAGVAAGLLWLREGGWRKAAGVATMLISVAAFALLALRMWPWVEDAYTNAIVQGKSLREIHLESRVAPQLLVAEYIVQHTAPDDRIALFSDSPWVYMLSDRRNATRFPFADVWAPAHGSHTNESFGQQFLEGMQRNTPKYFIITQDNYPWQGVTHIDNWKRLVPLNQYVEANYQYEADNGPFILFRRKDGS
jgi:hypothetical protein